MRSEASGHLQRVFSASRRMRSATEAHAQVYGTAPDASILRRGGDSGTWSEVTAHVSTTFTNLFFRCAVAVVREADMQHGMFRRALLVARTGSCATIVRPRQLSRGASSWNQRFPQGFSMTHIVATIGPCPWISDASVHTMGSLAPVLGSQSLGFCFEWMCRAQLASLVETASRVPLCHACTHACEQARSQNRQSRCRSVSTPA